MPKCRYCKNEFVANEASFCSEDCNYIHSNKYFLH